MKAGSTTSFSVGVFSFSHLVLRSIPYSANRLRWLESVLVFFDALYLGVKIFRLELANHDQILLQNNDK